MAGVCAPGGGRFWLCGHQAVVMSPMHVPTHQLGLTATSACVWGSLQRSRRFCSEILCLVDTQGHIYIDWLHIIISY